MASCVDNRARAETAGRSLMYFRVESGTSFAAFSRKMCRARARWPVLGGRHPRHARRRGGLQRGRLWRLPRGRAPSRPLQLHGERRASWIEAADLGLVYRGSVFTRGQFEGKAVLEAEVELAPGDAKALLAEAAAYDAKRLTAQPRGRNAGLDVQEPGRASPAWKLIEAVGMRGMRAATRRSPTCTATSS